MKFGFRWTIGGLLFLASLLNYLDRAALPIVAPMVKDELKIDAAQLGLIFSVFFVGYAVFNFVGGFLSDRVGPKRVYGVAMTVWSVFSGLTAIVTGFWQLMIFRIIFGLGEGPMGSVSNKTVRNWFPRQEAGFMVGVATSGGNLAGAAIAGPIIGFIALGFGWRSAFLVTLALGLLWLIPWLVLMSDEPKANRFVSKSEVDHIEAGHDARPAGASSDLPLGRFLRSPVIIAIALAFFAANYTQYFLLSWMPSYLTSARGLDIKTMSIVTAIPWIAGLVGCLLGGFVSDRIVSTTGDAILGRKIILVGTLGLVAIGLGLVMVVNTTTQAVALMAFVLFLEGMTPLACWALIQELAPANRVGGVGGFVHFLSNVAGIVGPSITGFIIQYGGGYDVSFLIAGAVAVIGAIAVMVLVRDDAKLALAVA
jgi:sugar phosphate permease